MRGLDGLLQVGKLAEQYCIDHVSKSVQLEAIRVLNSTNCVELLTASASLGLVQLEGACRDLLLESFDKVSATDGFLGLEEAALASLLDDDGLRGREAALYRGVIRWMLRSPAAAHEEPRGGGGGGNDDDGCPLRGKGLLSKLRLALLDDGGIRDALAGLPGLTERERREALAETHRQRAAQRRESELPPALPRPEQELCWGRLALGGGGIRIVPSARCTSAAAAASEQRETAGRRARRARH